MNSFISEQLPDMMTAKDIQSFLRVSKTRAYDILNSPGFPVIVIGGTKRVYSRDFIIWLEKHRKGSD